MTDQLWRIRFEPADEPPPVLRLTCWPETAAEALRCTVRLVKQFERRGVPLAPELHALLAVTATPPSHEP